MDWGKRKDFHRGTFEIKHFRFFCEDIRHGKLTLEKGGVKEDCNSLEVKLKQGLGPQKSLSGTLQVAKCP